MKYILEGKAIGTLTGKPDAEKQQLIQHRQSQRGFSSSVRAHSRAASKLLATEIARLDSALLSLVLKYRRATISLQTLKTRTSIVLKASAEQIFQYGVKAAGIVGSTGGLYRLTSHERKWLDSYIAEELKYWSNFLSQVKKLSDKQVQLRVHNYAESTRSIYDSGRVLSVGNDVIIYWELESDNPCKDCVFLSRHSPYTSDTLPTTPKAGKTICHSNCYCELRVMKVSPKTVTSVRKKNKRALWYLTQLKKNRKKV